MTRVIIEMDFNIGGFDSVTDDEKKEFVSMVIEAGADEKYAEIEIHSIELKEND